MEAFEKAKLLINEFLKIEDTQSKMGGNLMFIEEAKKCALISVDEIIEECSNWTGGTNDGWDRKRFDYWQSVKENIVSLKTLT